MLIESHVVNRHTCLENRLQDDKGSISKVHAVASDLRTKSRTFTNKFLENKTFSLLRLFWMMSLFFSARGQSSNQFPAVLELSSLDGTNGIMLFRENNLAILGQSVSSAGDVNGDGVTDIVIGAPHSGTMGKFYAGITFIVFGSSTIGVNSTIDLSNLNGINGFVVNGEQGGNYCGTSVSGAGDVNQDGIDDLLIGADGADHQGRRDAGKVYVIYGAKDIGNGGVFDLSSLNGQNGFVIVGEKSSDLLGKSVSGMGDVNGDGIADILVGAPYANHGSITDVGKTYVIFGGKQISDSVNAGVFEPQVLNGNNGFVIRGANYGDYCGFSLSHLFDFNGDGIDDIYLGAPNIDISENDYKTYTGNAYILFGGNEIGKSGSVDLAYVNSTTGYVFLGDSVIAKRGYNIACVGDINLDGKTDLVFGIRDASPSLGRNGAGITFVMFGGEHYGVNGMVDTDSANSSTLYSLNGINAGDHIGRPVSYLGDINGDGVNDFLIGGRYADPSGRIDAGSTYVVFGGKNIILGGTLELSSLDGANGFAIHGEQRKDQSGYSVSSGGDINGDGVMDLLIGARFASSPGGSMQSGRAYVIFGHLNNHQGSSATGGKTHSRVIQSSSLTPSTKSGAASQSVFASEQSDSSTTTTLLSQTSLATALPTKPTAILVDSQDHVSPVSPNDPTPLYVTIAIAVTALACSILSGGFYYIKRKTNRNKQEQIEMKTKNRENSPQNISHFQEFVRLNRDVDKELEYAKAPSPGEIYGDVIIENQSDQTYDRVDLNRNQIDGVYEEPTSKLD